MFFNSSYESDFDSLMYYLKSKYGDEMFDLDGIGKQLDLNIFSKNFFTNKTTTADVSVDSNSNVDTNDVISYIHELPKAFMRMNSYYCLWKKLKALYGVQEAHRIIESQVTGSIYINDFSDIGRPYCFNYSTYDVATSGLPMVNKIKSIPPKYLNSFKSQIEQFVVIASNSTLGATGLADLFVVMSYYIDKIFRNNLQDAHIKYASEEDVWKMVKEEIVSLIYTLNQPMRGCQSPFTNISLFDKYFLESLLPNYPFYEGNEIFYPTVETVNKLQDIYLEVMNEELKRTPVTFPVTTVCLSVNDDHDIQDIPFLEKCAEANKEFGFINFYHGKTSVLSSCCRLRSDTENPYFNTFGAGSSKIGSLGVVTINLARIGYKVRAMKLKTQEEMDKAYFTELEDVVRICGKINNAKRHILKKRIELGAMPLYDYGFMDLNKQYSTAGFNGKQ